MYIDDVLAEGGFSAAIEHLDKVVVKTAGEKSFALMKEVIGEDPQAIREWYFTPKMALEGKRPHDFYVAGKGKEVETLLFQIEFGVYR